MRALILANDQHQRRREAPSAACCCWTLLPLPALASANTLCLVRCELLFNVRTDWCSLLYLRANPHPELKNQPKLLWKIVPPVIIACLVSREVVINRMLPACTMRQDVISVPISGNVAPANVAPATCFLQNLRPLGSIEAMLSRSPISIFHLLAQTAQLNDSMPQIGQARRVIFLHFGPRVANTLRQARWTPDSEMNPRRNPASPARSCSARLRAYNQARAAPDLRRSRAAW